MKEFIKDYKEAVAGLFLPLLRSWARFKDWSDFISGYVTDVKKGIKGAFLIILSFLCLLFGPVLALLSPILAIPAVFIDRREQKDRQKAIEELTLHYGSRRQKLEKDIE